MRGFAVWLSTWMGMLLFAVAIFAAFSYFYAFETSYRNVDLLNKEADNVASAINALNAIRYDAQVTIELYTGTSATVSGKTITIYGAGTSTQRPVLGVVEGSSSDNSVLLVRTGGKVVVS